MSKGVTSRDPLVAFLFELIRDAVPLGTAERIIDDMEQLDIVDSVYENEHLGRYVISLAARIRALEPKDESRG